MLPSTVAEARYQRYWRTGLGDEYTFILLLKRFRFMARQCGVVNRVEGMIPEVVGLRGVDDYARTGSDCTKVTRKHVGSCHLHESYLGMAR